MERIKESQFYKWNREFLEALGNFNLHRCETPLVIPCNPLGISDQRSLKLSVGKQRAMKFLI
jgi:hypothetical protein